ncbi:MAG: LptF/LptG family permease, partial [bacterium]
NRENEFTALRLGGVSLYRLIFPLIILGIVISSVTYQMNERLVPWTYHEAQNIVRRFILRETMPEVQDNTFFQGPEGRLFFVSEFDQINNTLENVVVYNLPRGKDFPEMVSATSGKIEDNMWHLEDGIIHQFNGEGEYYHAVIFDHMSYELPEEIDSFFGEQRTTSEMSRKRLARDIELFQRSGINVNGLLVEYHLKLAMPLAALIFILIGTPLSLSHKDSRGASIILTILIVFLYYLALSLTQPLGKNGVVEPLIAAWLPNLIFGFFGLVLMILKEKWQNWASRFLPFFTVLLILTGLFTGQTIQAAEDESLNVSYADQLTYNQEYDKYELSGEIIAQYSKFHIFADEVTIVMEDGSEEQYENPGEIDIKKSQFTGCDLDEPHYHFNASEVIIYPDDHLIAKHVSFWELSGKLPLMYWPYLYLSLKEDDQRLIPEYGYNEERGWFVRSTYYYKYKNRLPGELYLDYYTKSGFAGGFKQHFFYENDLEGYLYLFAQENKTNIPGLFLWQGEIDIENSQSRWDTDTNIKFDFFETYSDINGKIDIINKEEDWLFDLNSNFQSKDYYDSNKNDDKDLTFELNYENEGLPYDWEYYLELYSDYKYNQEDGLGSRWGGLSYFSRKHNRYVDYRIILERKAPDFRTEDEEEDNVTYLRWPELELNYRPSGSFTYNILAGHYFENNTDTEAYRTHGKIDYRKRWNYNNIRFTTNHNLIARLYKELDNDSVDVYEQQTRFQGLPYQLAYSNDNTARITLLPDLIWTNEYKYTEYAGESPFSFDQIRQKDEYTSKLNYRRGDWDIRLNSGYNLLEESYLPLVTVLRWQIIPSLRLDMDTRYDINE